MQGPVDPGTHRTGDDADNWRKNAAAKEKERDTEYDQDESAMLLVDEDPLSLLNKFEKYTPPNTDKAAWALKLKDNPL